MTAATGDTEYHVAMVGGGAAGCTARMTWLDATAQADLVRWARIDTSELATSATTEPFFGHKLPW